MRRRERPIKRTNPSGKVVFVARWTARDGTYHYGWKPDIPGTYSLRREAQDAIEACYEREDRAPVRSDTVGGYFATWEARRPRSKVTNHTNTGRIRVLLDVEIEDESGRMIPFRDWQFSELRRRHASALVAFMLVERGRAVSGVKGSLSSLSCMTEDAIDDEVAIGNPFKGVRIRATDPRIQKMSRPIRVWSWEQMHEFACECAAPGGETGAALEAHRRVMAEPMVRLLSDCGLRVGEMLALRRADLDLEREMLRVWQTLTGFGIEPGTKTDKLRGVTNPDDMGRYVPVPPALCELLRAMPKRIDSQLLFPALRGGAWMYTQWYVDVWCPAHKPSGMDPRPHEFRHSQISLLRAAGIDPADLAAVSGHTVLTQTRTYVHGLGRSFDAMREAVGP